MSPPTIRLAEIPEEGLSLEVPLDATWLRGALAETGLEPAGTRAGRADVRFDRDGKSVTVSGHLDVHLLAECVACLGEVPLPLDEDFQLHLEPRPAGPPPKAHEEVELSADELDVDYYDDEAIDLATWLREQILLAAPVHPRHEGECPVPLTPPTAANGEAARAIDPRLLPLQKFIKKE